VPDLAAIPGMAELWALTRGEPAVRVALIDGPVDLEHPCFEGTGLEVVEPSWLPREREVTAYPHGYGARLGHGTWVASVLFGALDSAVPGLACGCTGVLVPSLRGEATDHDPSNAARAIEGAMQAGASVVVAELCLPSRSGDVDDLVKRAVRGATRDGALVIAAAGNEEALSSCFPAALPDVLAVGAYDDEGRVFGFSNWGPAYDGHGIVAPGGNIIGATPGGGTKHHKGTSCSTPVVAGVAALLLSLQAQRGTTPDPAAVRHALISSAAPCSARDTDGNPQRCIAGRLDVRAATELVLSDLKRAARGSVPLSGRPRGAMRASSAEPEAQPPGTPVFALGRIGYDFGTRARRDSFARLLAGDAVRFADPSDERSMADHLARNPSDVMALTWTLRRDATPIYAVAPSGSYVGGIDAQLIDLLRRQQILGDARVERMSLPGRLTGSDVELLSGEVVPVVELQSHRGLRALSIAEMADGAAREAQPPGSYNPATQEALREALREYLARIYLDMANPGRTSAQRALNFAGTTPLLVAGGLRRALADGKVLDTIHTEPSTVGRPGSDCWDVRVSFVDPENNRRSRDVFRFSFDVSDTVPVTLGSLPALPEPPPELVYGQTM
jgi:Subtilase family/PatG C-terminal